MFHKEIASEATGAVQLSPTVTQLIVREAAKRDGVIALHDQKTGRRMSYQQLASATRHAAKAVAQRGLQKGEVVCLYSPNLPEYAVAILTVTLAGGVVTLAAPALETETLVHQLFVTNARWLVTTKALLSKAVMAASQTAVQQLYSFDPALGAHHVGELFEAVIAEGERPTEALIDSRRDLMAWLFDAAGRDTTYSFATAASKVKDHHSLSGVTELDRVSLADQDALWILLEALMKGRTVLL